MDSQHDDLVGRRVTVHSWYGHARLIAAYRVSPPVWGVITGVNGVTGDASVQIDGYSGTYTVKLSDLKV